MSSLKGKEALSSGGANRAPASINLETRDAIHRFVRVLANRGCPATTIQEEVAIACGKIGDLDVSGWGSIGKVDEAAHVLTLWFSDPGYTDSGGAPRPLSVAGPAPSLEALVRRVDPALRVQGVLELLLKAGSLRRIGRRYVPRKRALVMREARDVPEVLGGLFGHLQTFEHNGWGPRNSPRLELYSVNRNIPVRAVQKLEGKMRPMAERLLTQADATFHDAEADRQPGEQTVHMGIGVYQWILDPSAPALSPRSLRSKRPRTR